MENAIVLSLRPKYWRGFLNREKLFELRKTYPAFSTPGKTHPKLSAPFMAYVYETKNDGGRGKIVGVLYFDFITSVRCAQDISSEKTMLSEQEIDSYIGDKAEIFAWFAGTVREIEPQDISALGLSRPPQSWQYCKGEHIYLQTKQEGTSH